MSNLSLFTLLTLGCLGSLVYVAPRQIKALNSVGINLPISKNGVIFQGGFLSTISAFLGVALSSRTGFTLLALREVGEFSTEQKTLLMTFSATVLTTLVAFAGHYVIYYLVFRPQLPSDYVIVGEGIRLRMGILARILQGGLVEEVQFRWGAMSLIVWFGFIIFPNRGDTIIWGGIVIAAVLFGLFHLIGAVQLGMGNSKASISLTIIDNMMVGIAFGWLFWQYGLVAAIISHALIHVIWFPIERFHFSRFVERKNAA